MRSFHWSQLEVAAVMRTGGAVEFTGSIHSAREAQREWRGEAGVFFYQVVVCVCVCVLTPAYSCPFFPVHL